MDLHENSFYIYSDINKWEKIVAVEIREQSANIAHPKPAGSFKEAKYINISKTKVVSLCKEVMQLVL